MKAVTIIPGSSCCQDTYETCRQAVKSHHESCDADLLFLDNNSDDFNLRGNLQKDVESLGYRYEYLDGEVHINAFYNYGTDLTASDEEPSELVTYCNADVVFFPGWLEAIRVAWKTENHWNAYFSMHPYSYSPMQNGVCYRNSTEHSDRVIECDHPLMHASVLRRDQGFVFDPQFSFWETDCDFWMTLKCAKKKSGVVYAARVDHIGGGISDHQKHDDPTGAKESAKDTFNVKWSPLIGDHAIKH